MHVGFVDSDLTAGLDVPKTSLAVVAAQTQDAVEKGVHEVLVDDHARNARAASGRPVARLIRSWLAEVRLSRRGSAGEG